jgi:hypothetical protein
MNALLSHPPHMAMRFVNLRRIAHRLPALEQEEFVLAHYKVDIAIIVVVHAAPKSRRSHNAMPRSIVFLLKFIAHIICHILKKGNVSTFGISQPNKKPTNQAHNFSVLTYIIPVFLYQCKYCTIDSILLHFIRHLNIYENGVIYRHLA